MLPDQIQTAEHASVLPVNQLYDLAVAKILDLRDDMDKMPKDPSGRDDTPSLEGLRDELGIDSNTTRIHGTDFSMFIMGGMQMAAMDAFGTAAGTAVAHAADVGVEWMMQRSDNDNGKTSFKRAADPKADAKPSLKTSFRRAHEPAKKPALAATSIVRAAMQRKQMDAYKKSLKKRRAMHAKMVQLKEMIKVLNVYKKHDISYVKMSADGKELSPINGKPRFVYEMENKKLQNREAYEFKMAAPAPRMAA